MITPAAEVQAYLSVSEANYTALGIDVLHESVEVFVKNYCKREFESTAYTNERYSGHGYKQLYLNNFPITTLDRVSIGYTDVIKICNTNTTSSASVSVLTTGLRLVYNGSADVTVTWASYATLTTVVAAVNALGSGWSASLLNSSYANFKSTDLIPKYGLNTLDSNWVYLSIPEDAEDSFDTNIDEGYIYGFWPEGHRNIYVTYTAGYSATTMPEDLKYAIKMFIQYIYSRKKEESFGLNQYRIGYNSVLSIFEESDFPKEVKSILSVYKRIKV